MLDKLLASSLAEMAHKAAFSTRRAAFEVVSLRSATSRIFALVDNNPNEEREDQLTELIQTVADYWGGSVSAEGSYESTDDGRPYSICVLFEVPAVIEDADGDYELEVPEFVSVCADTLGTCGATVG